MNRQLAGVVALRRHRPVQGRNERSVAPLNAALVDAARRPHPVQGPNARFHGRGGFP
jgi:hypothetical protein